MSLTIGNWFLVAIILLSGIGISIYLYSAEYSKKDGIKKATINMVIVLILVVGTIYGLNWYHTSTASGKRGYKDFQSELHENIYRELIITAEDGREIFRYEGRFDIERHAATGDDRYIRFESEDGKRYTIIYGVQDTVLIIEKDAEGE